MIKDFEFIKEYNDFEVGDTIREPYSGIARYFVREELELIKEKALN